MAGSNLQGHEDVEDRRSERPTKDPLEQHAASNKWKLGGLGLGAKEHRPPVRRTLFYLRPPLRREVFVVITSHRSKGRKRIDDPSIVGLGREKEKQQKVVGRIHLQECA